VDSPADINRDSVVDLIDLNIVMNGIGADCRGRMRDAQEEMP